MKKKLGVLLVTIICVFLSACGGATAEEEIIGRWTYNTGITTWNFVFNEDMTCSYWAGAKEPQNSTYKMESGELTIDNSDWEFYYEIKGKELQFRYEAMYDDGTKKIWRFVKDTTYNPKDITSLALTKSMLAEIEEEATSASFYQKLLLFMNLQYEDLEFTEWKITDMKKTDPYTYVVYGVLYARNNYGEKYYQNSNVIFTMVEDAEKENGYSIKWEIKLVE